LTHQLQTLCHHLMVGKPAIGPLSLAMTRTGDRINQLRVVSRRQLRVRSGGSARIGYAALAMRSTLEVDRALPNAVLSTHRSR
jgi:hypothetical protein